MTGPGQWRRIRADLVAMTLVGVFVALWYVPWLTGRRAFFQVDTAFVGHPIRVHAFAMLRSGVAPLWTDHVLAGFPLFAEGQIALLHPLTWLYFLPATTALNLLVVIRFVLLALSTYLFLRRRPASRVASAFGSLTLAFSSFVLVEHVLPGFLAQVAVLPLVLLAGERALQRRSSRALVGTAVLLASIYLAGDALGMLLCTLLFVGWMLAGVRRTGSWGLARRVCCTVAPIVLGAGLAAVQLIPTWEFLRETTRAWPAARSPDREYFPPAELLLTGVSPNYFGTPMGGYSGPSPGWEESLFYFVGLAPLFLALFGLDRRDRSWFWMAVCIAGVSLATRDFLPVSQHVWSLPVFRLFRWPAHAMLWFVMGMTALATLGFVRLVDGRLGEPPLSRWRVATVGGAAVALILEASRDALLTWPGPGELFQQRQRDLVVFVTCWTMLSIVSRLVLRDRLPRWCLALCVFLVFVWGVATSPRPGGVDPRVYETEPAAARFVKARFGPRARILSLGAWDPAPHDEESLRERYERLPENAHLLFGLRSVSQFDVEETATLRRPRAALVGAPLRFARVLGVNAVLAPPEPDEQTAVHLATAPAEGYALCRASAAVDLFCSTEDLPRAFLVREWRVTGADMPALGMRGDLRRMAWLDREPLFPASGGAAATDGVHFVRDGPGLVDLVVRATDPAVLVLADTFYPGWSVTVDGAPRDLLLADGFVRAVAVGAGTHRVLFRFRPVSLLAGGAVSLATALGCLALLVFGGTRHPP